MKKIIKYLFFAATLVGAASCGTSSKALSSQSAVNTGFVCVSLMNDGSLIVRCTASGPSREAAMENAMGGVVEAMIFSGISGDAASRIRFQEPLAGRAAVSPSDNVYLKQFFSQRKYRQFVSVIPNVPPTFIRSGGGYKVTADLVLMKNRLRADLEAGGVIKSLGNIL